MTEVSGSGYGGSSSSEPGMLSSVGTGYLTGASALAARPAAMIGSLCALFVPGEFAALREE